MFLSLLKNFNPYYGERTMFDYQMDDKMYTYVICCYGLNNIHTHADSFMVYYDHRIFKNEDEAINVILPTIREHCINVPIILKDEAVLMDLS